MLLCSGTLLTYEPNVNVSSLTRAYDNNGRCPRQKYDFDIQLFLRHSQCSWRIWKGVECVSIVSDKVINLLIPRIFGVNEPLTFHAGKLEMCFTSWAYLSGAQRANLRMSAKALNVE